ESFTEKAWRICREIVEANDEDAVGALFGIDDGHVDDVACYFDIFRLRPSFAEHSQRHFASFRATNTIDGGCDVHSLCDGAIDFKDEILRFDARALGWRAFERRDDGENLVFDCNFHTNASEFTTQIFVELLFLDRREEERVRVAC